MGKEMVASKTHCCRQDTPTFRGGVATGGYFAEGLLKHVPSPASVAPILFPSLPFPYLGSPLQFYVDAINARHVSAYGPGLSHGMVNKPATFTIITKDAGEGRQGPKLSGRMPPLHMAILGAAILKRLRSRTNVQKPIWVSLSMRFLSVSCPSLGT